VFAAEKANPLKVAAMRGFGADVRLVGSDFDAAKQAAISYALENGLRYVEDGSDSAIAEGAGTIALELLPAARFDVILVPLGNGALLAGVGTVLRAMAPRVRIIAVVAENAPAMKLSMEAGRAVQTATANTIADGIAVRVPIPATLQLLRECCDEESHTWPPIPSASRASAWRRFCPVATSPRSCVRSCSFQHETSVSNALSLCPQGPGSSP